MVIFCLKIKIIVLYSTYGSEQRQSITEKGIREGHIKWERKFAHLVTSCSFISK